jgi:RNA polymerase sigma-70 factor, ECF subfamily
MTMPRKPDRLNDGLDADAFMALYEHRAEETLAFFARRTLDAQIAADLTAETFAEAFSSRHGFDPRRGDAGAWLFGIARHRLARYLRNRSVERSARARLGFPQRGLNDADLERVEALIDFADVGRRIQAALSTLNADQREAVVLRVIDELGYPQIAERLGLTEETARARVSRGLRSLAVSLATDTDAPRGATS